jgi:hypothetical protein
VPIQKRQLVRDTEIGCEMPSLDGRQLKKPVVLGTKRDIEYPLKETENQFNS